MMTLRDYLSGTRTRQSDFARLVGVTQATVSRLVSGAVVPTLELAARIKQATNGEVGFESWVTCSDSDAPAPFNQESSHDNPCEKPASDAA